MTGDLALEQCDERERHEALGATERALFDAGRAAHPEISLGFEAFLRGVAGHDAPGQMVFAADMYLAVACAEHVAAALGRLEQLLTTEVSRAVASIDSSPAFVEEVLQGTRQRIIVAAPGSRPRIATYAGRASLKSWLCAVAIRTAVSQRRRSSSTRSIALDGQGDEALAPDSPELEYLRRRYKDHFEDAVRSAIEGLPARDRLLLRLNVIEGMSIDQLGGVYKVGRSTAARWLAAARRSLFERARSELQDRLGVDSAELASLAGDLQSHLDASVLKLLGASPR